MFKPFSLVFFIAVLAWIGSVLITTDPQKRIDRFCVPVEYTDRAATSGMQLLDASWGASTHKFFENIQYGCRFVVWKMFYEEEWNRSRETPNGAADTGAEKGAPPVRKPAHSESEKVDEKKAQKE